MGKVKKKKAHLKFDYNKNRKKIRKNEKKIPDIRCPEIKHAWDKKKSMRQNLKDMGLSSDPNKTIKFPKKASRRGKIENVVEMDVETTPVKKFVVDGLETQSKIPYEKKVTMSDEEAAFCIYMMDKHGEDYKAMSRDRRNVYQETPKQIKRKIERFKTVPELSGAYAESRQEIPILVKENLHAEPATNLPPYPESQQQSFLGMAPHRYSTRLYDAGLRNGHFVSPQLSCPMNVSRFAPTAALCRVKRRLQFGRKAPKDRTGPAVEEREM